MKQQHATRHGVFYLDCVWTEQAQPQNRPRPRRRVSNLEFNMSIDSDDHVTWTGQAQLTPTWTNSDWGI